MATDSLADLVERLRSNGHEPRQIGDDAWETRCLGRSSVAHMLRLGRDRNGYLELKCQSPENCTFTANLKTLIERYQVQQAQSAAISERPAAEIPRLLSQSPEAAVPDPFASRLPAAASAEKEDITTAEPAVCARDHGCDSSASSDRAQFSDEKSGPPHEDTTDEQNGRLANASESGALLWHGLPARENGDHGQDARATSVDVHATHGQDARAASALDEVSHGQDARATSETGDPASEDDASGSSATTSGDTEKSGATEKLRLNAAGARPFRRPDGQYSVSIAVDGHQECHALESPEVVRWLTRRFYESAGRLPSASAISATVRALAAHADIAGTAEADFVRVGCNESGSSLFLDMGDSTWRAIEIQATGWQVVENPNVHFRRSSGQRALPVPAHDGSLAPLLKYVNVEHADLPLLIAWLTAALRPTGPHPILAITGEQGSAKSTLARICRLLVDPHSAPLRAEPKDHRDLMVAALHGWVQAYDNLSAMPDWLSNGLCRLVTGGGISTRGLFTNHDEVVWSAQRPIILTSIDDIVQRPDVIDRSIFLHLRSITPSSRRREQDLWAEFMIDYPRILGGLLDAVAAGLRLWSEIRLPELERMADFTHWGEAVAQGVGWAPGTFVTAYRANRQAANFVSLEESLMAQALLELAKYNGPWKGTLTQFLEFIAESTGYHAITTPGWPKTPSRAAVELRRIAPQLRMFGVSVTFDRSSRAGRIITFTPSDSSRTTRTHVG